MNKEEILDDYTKLIEHKAVYQEIANQDEIYWLEVAKSDQYDVWIATKAEKYDIAVDYEALESDLDPNEIYYLEEELLTRLKALLI